jgi:SET domain-containing protein
MPATTRASSQPFEVRESPVHGRGAFATRRIRAGARVGEYTGERISTRVADARYADDQIESHHTFLFAVDARTVIDATREGGDVRFINHSGAPSCEAQMEDKRIFIVALRDIAAGEELFYDYALQREEEAGPEWATLYVCRCGAPTCRGTLLRPPAPKKRAAVRAKKRPAAGAKKTSRRAAGAT